MQRHRHLLWVVALVCAGSSFASEALAQKKPKLISAAATKTLIHQIQSGDAAKVVVALNQAQDAGFTAQKVVPSIEELLRQGTSVPVAIAAMQALAAIGQDSSSAVIRPYVKHRNKDVRNQAVKALLKTKGADATAAFKEGLHSTDSVVRGYSATGLGNLGAKDALPQLDLALLRNVHEAAGAIGQLCDPQECRAFAHRLGTIPFDVMTSGLDPILFRQPSLPEELLIDIVAHVGSLGTLEAGKYLADVQSRWPPTGAENVAKAIEHAIASIGQEEP